MSLTSYRAAPSRDTFGSSPSGYEPDEAFVLSKLSRRVCNKRGLLHPATGCFASFRENVLMFFTRSGGDLLSHVLRRSTISATALNGRVRNGIGCFARAMATRPSKEHLSGLARGALLEAIVPGRTPFWRVCFRIQPCCFWIGSSLSDH